MKTKAEEIFNKFCTKLNKDYSEYIIRDKKGFIEAISALESQEELKPTDEDIEQLILSILKETVQYDDGDMVHLTSQLEEVSAVIVRSIDHYLKSPISPTNQKTYTKVMLKNAFLTGFRSGEKGLTFDKAVKWFDRTFKDNKIPTSKTETDILLDNKEYD